MVESALVPSGATLTLGYRVHKAVGVMILRGEARRNLHESRYFCCAQMK